MYSKLLARFAVSVMALSGTAIATGLTGTLFRRDLKLAAEMGITPDILLSQKKSIHTIAHETAMSDIAAEYVSVRVLVVADFMF